MKVVATSRKLQGTGASRRLRRSGYTPGIIYGGSAEPAAITIEHNPLYHSLRVEAFHSSILDMELDGKPEKVLLRAVQWHAFKPLVLHVDFQRVDADQKIQMKVPLHFVNQEISPAVKLHSALVNHVVNEIEVHCLPADLPSFIEVDLANLEVGKAVHLSSIKLPEGVTPITHGKDEDPVLVNAAVPGGTAAADEAADDAKK
ncbi:MAG: 50S ribosomal protein L25/general stress protein Ctc [Burkholderiaceae bacterium]